MHGRSCRGLLALCGLLLAAPLPLRGQADRKDSKADFGLAPVPPNAAPGFSGRVQPPPKPPSPIAALPGPINLAQMTRAAGSIFSGTVASIARPTASSSPAVETVAITFHVENALRGALPGQDLTIQQWTGLWRSGQRYRVGERMLIFLYPPSKLGLTSCVEGKLGRFAIDSAGRVVLSAQHAAAFATDPLLGGKSRISLRNFAQAVGRAGGEE